MKSKLHIIYHPADLKALSVLPLKRWPGQRRVAISERLIPSPKRESLERQLNEKLFACGCPQATIGLLLAVVGYVAWALVLGSDIGIARHIGQGIGAAAAGTMIGKFVGLLAAERRLKQVADEIRNVIPPETVKQPPSPVERLICF